MFVSIYYTSIKELIKGIGKKKQVKRYLRIVSETKKKESHNELKK